VPAVQGGGWVPHLVRPAEGVEVTPSPRCALGLDRDCRVERNPDVTETGKPARTGNDQGLAGLAGLRSLACSLANVDREHELVTLDFAGNHVMFLSRRRQRIAGTLAALRRRPWAVRDLRKAWLVRVRTRCRGRWQRYHVQRSQMP